MNHDDHVNLLRKGIPTLAASGPTWVRGRARSPWRWPMIGPTGTIYAVDKDAGALRQLARGMQTQFPAVTLHCVTGDFTQPLALPALDGVVMANSLHFIQRKEPVLQQVRSYLQPAGRLLLVEYNTDTGNMWVPHPLSFPTWAKLAARCGFADTELLATQPSRFLREFYTAGSRQGKKGLPV